ncbi:unnamed protein product [Rotaria sordida]|uniref:Uncharacterized protein n=1 Tax=Rotaria sordida TaxID=392033 RepID=A0A819XAM9_9BILA|nr:unnamed protein product [Rotaria sordida]CAF4133695.1 unnamed protein product [Rotaria sordida]
MNIYADPYNNRSSQRLSLLLDQSNVDEFPVEPYLDEIEQDEEESHFLDEIDITNDAIIHQSPFNVKACERMPLLKQLIRKEPMKKKPTNPLFSIEIVHLFYKWFAYVPLWSGIMTEFVDSDASSSSLLTHSVFNQSFEFSIKSSNPAELNRDNVSILSRSPSSSSCSNFDGPLHSRQVAQDNLLTSVPYIAPSEPETTDTEENVRRSSRHRTPNPKYANDYISPIISPNLLSRALSPKRPLSSSNNTISVDVMEKISDEQRKKIKKSLLHSSKKQQSRFSKQPFTTTLGSLNLTWPRYGIKNGIYEGQSFSITRTCPVDTGLFVLYHAYKAGTDGFRKLFENDTVDAFIALRQTFQYVESHDWTMARLH